jgi:hypothetical protein
MKPKDLYSNAHLVVAAIRVSSHRNQTPPSVEDVCDTLAFSPEEGHRLCRRLEEPGIIEIVDSAYGPRLFVRDHLKIESLDRTAEGPDKLSQELQRFQKERKGISKSVESFKAQQAERQKQLFASLDSKLKGKKSSEDGSSS